jgi:hypothetical protein
MTSRRAVLAFLLVLSLIAFTASAQQAAEYGRAAGGELTLTPKGAAPLSGSLELSLSSGNRAFGGSSPAYGATAGGTLLQDRLWFFASAARQRTSPTMFAQTELPMTAPMNATSRSIGARVNGQLGASQSFSAFFESARRPELSTVGTSSFASSVPSTFLSLHYTGIVSSNMFFTGSMTSNSRTVPAFGTLSLQ